MAIAFGYQDKPTTKDFFRLIMLAQIGIHISEAVV
jgi:hypothetical protein